MTRKTIYRLILATLLLPNFTAYWWMLPRRFKRCPNYNAYLRREMFRALIAQHHKFAARSLAMKFQFEQVESPSKHLYRIPFQVN